MIPLSQPMFDVFALPPPRRPSTLGYLSSMDFERQALVA